tara:strand:- start:87 stop:476 length:390 start_codon:yes stop_codon:yes gene_type:complete
MKKLTIVLSLLTISLGLLGGQAANNIFEEVEMLEEQNLNPANNENRAPPSPEYIGALYDEGSFVAFFSRALIFLGVFFTLYGFIDDLKKLKRKDISKNSENTVKLEETYEEFKLRKKKFREAQRKQVSN